MKTDSTGGLESFLRLQKMRKKKVLKIKRTNDANQKDVPIDTDDSDVVFIDFFDNWRRPGTLDR